MEEIAHPLKEAELKVQACIQVYGRNKKLILLSIRYISN
jgi:hypothetical protein